MIMSCIFFSCDLNLLKYKVNLGVNPQRFHDIGNEVN